MARGGPVRALPGRLFGRRGGAGRIQKKRRRLGRLNWPAPRRLPKSRCLAQIIFPPARGAGALRSAPRQSVVSEQCFSIQRPEFADGDEHTTRKPI